METTITSAPVISDLASEYIETLKDYNELVQNMNTCYGGETEPIYTQTFGEDITMFALKMIEKNRKFAAKRKAQTAKAEALALILEDYIKQGAAQEYVDYLKANYEYKKATGQLN